VIKSQFKFWAILPPSLTIAVTWILYIVTSKLLINSTSEPPFFVYIIIPLFMFTWIWLIFSELRTKALKISIEENGVRSSNFLGLGKSKWYGFEELDGLTTTILPSKYDRYEFLYLIKERKKVVKISQFYHSNYAELKQALLSKNKDLGFQNYSLLGELKELLQ
jgi:hypothetical protein